MALLWHDGGTSARDRVHIPAAVAAAPDAGHLKAVLQRPRTPAVRGVAPGDPQPVLAVPPRPLPVPVPQHCVHVSPVRVPAPDVAGSDRRAGQGRPRGDHFLAADRDHPALSAHHGQRLGALQDGRHVHYPEGGDSPLSSSSFFSPFFWLAQSSVLTFAWLFASVLVYLLR